MSKLRPECGTDSNLPSIGRGVAAYYSIYNAVREADGLIHGRLHNSKGEHCAIGQFWEANPRVSIPTEVIDEIASVNDSVPPSPSDNRRKRKQAVLRYLRWKLQTMGFRLPGGQVKTP